MISKLHPQRAGGLVQKCSTLYTSLLSQYILICVCVCVFVKQQCKVFTCPLIQEPEKSGNLPLFFFFVLRPIPVLHYILQTATDARSLYNAL